MFVKGGSFLAHAACGGEDKRREHAMFHVLDFLFAFSFFADSCCFRQRLHLWSESREHLGGKYASCVKFQNLVL